MRQKVIQSCHNRSGCYKLHHSVSPTLQNAIMCVRLSVKAHGDILQFTLDPMIMYWSSSKKILKKEEEKIQQTN